MAIRALAKTVVARRRARRHRDLRAKRYDAVTRTPRHPLAQHGTPRRCTTTSARGRRTPERAQAPKVPAQIRVRKTLGSADRRPIPTAVYRQSLGSGRCPAIAPAILLAAVLVFLGVGAHAALNGSGGGPASAAGAGNLAAAAPPSVVAMPGDSLWNIAREHHGDVEFERYLEKLIDLNGGTMILAGQLVRLP